MKGQEKKVKEILKELESLGINEVKVVGIRLGVSANTGKPSNTIAYLERWKDYELEKGACGAVAKNIWTNVDFSGVAVGDIIELKWGSGYEGKATVLGWRMVKAAAISK